MDLVASERAPLFLLRRPLGYGVEVQVCLSGGKFRIETGMNARLHAIALGLRPEQRVMKEVVFGGS
jgi:hypothetical protein